MRARASLTLNKTSAPPLLKIAVPMLPTGTSSFSPTPTSFPHLICRPNPRNNRLAPLRRRRRTSRRKHSRQKLGEPIQKPLDEFHLCSVCDAPRIGLFYTSAAAMTRAQFQKLGGFDRNYRGASIAEDTEFGHAPGAPAPTSSLTPPSASSTSNPTVSAASFPKISNAPTPSLSCAYANTARPFTSVPTFYQLAVPTIYLTVLSIALPILALIFPILPPPTTLLLFPLIALLIFYLLNLSLLSFLTNKRSLPFALRAAPLLPADVFVVGLGMLNALFDFARGKRY